MIQPTMNLMQVQNSNTDEELASVVDFMEDFKKNITLGLGETEFAKYDNFRGEGGLGCKYFKRVHFHAIFHLLGIYFPPLNCLQGLLTPPLGHFLRGRGGGVVPLHINFLLILGLHLFQQIWINYHSMHSHSYKKSLPLHFLLYTQYSCHRQPLHTPHPNKLGH